MNAGDMRGALQESMQDSTPESMQPTRHPDLRSDDECSAHGVGHVPLPVRRSWLQEHALSLVLLALFLASFGGQYAMGYRVANDERREHGEPAIAWLEYARDPHFLSATFENWESEFLQMGLYVMLGAWLYQRGSAESRPFPEDRPSPRIEAGVRPWAARRGGWIRRLYGASLSIALLLWFVIAFVAHWVSSWHREAAERARSGLPVPDLWAYLGDAQFWFESFQNWQSEFLAVLAVVLLSIVLRQEGSPQSKPLDAPHRQTGS